MNVIPFIPREHPWRKPKRRRELQQPWSGQLTIRWVDNIGWILEVFCY